MGEEELFYDPSDKALLDKLVKSRKAMVGGAQQMQDYIEKRTVAEKKAVEDALQQYHEKIDQIRNSQKFKVAEERYSKLVGGFNKDVQEAAKRFSELVDQVKESKTLSEADKEKRIEGMYKQAMDIIYPEHASAFRRQLLLIL